MLRLPNDVVALLNARRLGGDSLYNQARDIVSAAARSAMIDCGFTAEEYSELDLLAQGIGFTGIAEMVKYLSLAYLRLARRQPAPDGNEVVQTELAEMFGELYNTKGYEQGITVTTTPRKIRGL